MSKTVALYVATYVHRWLPVGVELLCKSACHVLTLASIYRPKCTTGKKCLVIFQHHGHVVHFFVVSTF